MARRLSPRHLQSFPEKILQNESPQPHDWRAAVDALRRCLASSANATPNASGSSQPPNPNGNVTKKMQNFSKSRFVFTNIQQLFSFSRKVPPALFKHAIHACGRAGQPALAMELLGEMRKCSLQPTIDLFGSVANGFARNGDSRGCSDWVESMPQKQMRPNTIIYNTLINSYSKGGDGAAAERVLLRMLTENVATNNTSWNSVINAKTKSGNLQEVMRVFNLMQANGLTPDRFTFSGVLSAVALSAEVKNSADCPSRTAHVRTLLEGVELQMQRFHFIQK